MQKGWSVLFGIVMLLAAGLFVIAPSMGWWLPKNVSSYGHEVDNLFYFILAVTGFFFVLTEGILVYNMFRFAGEPGKKAQYVHGHHRLEIVWTLVPAVILIVLAVSQISTWRRIKEEQKMPAPDVIMEVSARQFEWRVRYPSANELNSLVEKGQVNVKMAGRWAEKSHIDDVHAVNEIHIWKGANVRIYLKTKDVLHSLYFPHLRLKQDAVPGKTIPVWFNAIDFNTKFNEKTGRWQDGYDPVQKKWAEKGEKAEKDYVWDLACAELCGRDHAKMLGRLYVHESKEEYQKWLDHKAAEQNQKTPDAVKTAER